MNENIDQIIHKALLINGKLLIFSTIIINTCQIFTRGNLVVVFVQSVDLLYKSVKKKVVNFFIDFSISCIIHMGHNAKMIKSEIIKNSPKYY